MKNVIVTNSCECNLTEFIDDGMISMFLSELVKLDERIKALEPAWKTEYESRYGKERFAWENGWWGYRLDMILECVNKYNENEDRYFEMRYYGGEIYAEALDSNNHRTGLYFKYVEI